LKHFLKAGLAGMSSPCRLVLTALVLLLSLHGITLSCSLCYPFTTLRWFWLHIFTFQQKVPTGGANLKSDRKIFNYEINFTLFTYHQSCKLSSFTHYRHFRVNNVIYA